MSEFKLDVEPADKIVFTSKKLGEESVTTTWKITNTLKERIAYKVKCTSNELFRIRPPVGALKPGENIAVNLVFNGGHSVPDNGKHFFNVYYVTAADEKKKPREVWNEVKEHEGNKKCYIDFSKGDEEKKEEKKEDEKKEDKKEEEKKDEKKEAKEEPKEAKEEKKEAKDEKKEAKEEPKEAKEEKKEAKEEKKETKDEKKDGDKKE